MTFPEASKGSYLLLLHLDAPGRLTIGRLGTFDFPAGWLVYTGSALGSGGLRGRLNHHLAPVKKPHWHVDYLRQAAVCREVWYAVGDVSFEHAWASTLLQLPDTSIPVARFGASDCRCPAHLVAFPAKPQIAAFNALAEVKVRAWVVP